jgi:hypothetical protein
MDALVIKQYPRQHHSRITIVCADGEARVFNNRTTSVELLGTMASTLAVVNQFEDENAVEPHTHEVLLYPISIKVEAVEEIRDNGAPVQDAEPKPAESDGESAAYDTSTPVH